MDTKTFYNIAVGENFYFIPSIYDHEAEHVITEHVISNIKREGSTISLYCDDFFNGTYPFLSENMVDLLTYTVNNNRGWYGVDKFILHDDYNNKINQMLENEQKEREDFIRRSDCRIKLYKESLIK